MNYETENNEVMHSSVIHDFNASRITRIGLHMAEKRSVNQNSNASESVLLDGCGSASNQICAVGLDLLLVDLHC